MAKRRHTPEHVIDKLREAEAVVLATFCRIQWSGIGIRGARMVLSSGQNGSPFEWWS